MIDERPQQYEWSWEKMLTCTFILKPVLLAMETTNELWRYTGNTLELSHYEAHLQQIPI